MRMHSFKASTRFSWRAADLQGRPARPEFLQGLVSHLFWRATDLQGGARHRSGSRGAGPQSLSL